MAFRASATMLVVKSFTFGLLCFIKGYFFGITNDSTRGVLIQWCLSLGKYLLITYGGLVVFGLGLSPVLFLLLLWSPSTLIQVLNFAHLCIFDFAVHLSSVKPDQLFWAARSRQQTSLIAPSEPAFTSPVHLLNGPRTTISTIHHMWISLRQTIRATQRFLGFSLILLLISVVFPGGGSVVAVCGSLYLMAESLYFSLLAPYFESKGWGFTDRVAFFREHRACLFGFLLPSAVFASVPFVGPFSLGLSQIAIATLLLQLLKAN